MEEGHIELPCPCGRVCVYMCVCLFPESSPTHSFVPSGGISKLFDTNNHHDKSMCRVQEPCRWLENWERELCTCAIATYARVRPITWSCMVRFQGFLAQIVIMTRRCVAGKDYVASLKVSVTLGK